MGVGSARKRLICHRLLVGVCFQNRLQFCVNISKIIRPNSLQFRGYFGEHPSVLAHFCFNRLPVKLAIFEGHNLKL